VANKNHTPPSNERVRARFMLVDLEGTSQDLQQIAQAFAHAVKASHPAVVQMPALPAPQEPAPMRALNSAAEANGHGAATLNGEVATEPAPAPADTASPSKPQNGSKRKLRTPVLISELEFTSGPKTFQAYIEEQAPKDHSKRYLAIAYWLRQFRSIAEISIDHVYTCYRALGLGVPDDVGGVLRGLKRQAWMETGSAKGFFKLTHIGENQLIPEKTQG
jgi:hypothetical protein